MSVWRALPNDVERFTEGDCHFLARAIHLRTGWTMCAFTFGGQPDLHVFVRMPDGNVIDVEGVRSLKEMRKRWDYQQVSDFDWPTLRGYFTAPSFGRYTYNRAHQIAERLLAAVPLATSGRNQDSDSAGGVTYQEAT